MTPLFLILAAAALALVVFTLRRDTYASPAGALGLGLVRAGGLCALAVLCLSGPAAEKPAPEVLFVLGPEAQAVRETPRRLGRLVSQAQSWAGSLQVLASGPIREETPSLHGSTFMGHALTRYPDLAAAMERSRWEAGSGRDTLVVFLVGQDLPAGALDIGLTPRVVTVQRQETRAIRSLVLPGEGFSGAKLSIRSSLLPEPRSFRVELFLDGRQVEGRAARDRVGDLQAEPEFSLELPEPGPHSVSLVVLDDTGAVLDRRSSAIQVLDRPRVLYVSPPGPRSPLERLLRGAGFEVKLFPVASLADDSASPFTEAVSGDLVVLDSPPAAYLGEPVLRTATRALFDRGASLLVVPGEALRESDRGAPLERVWPARLGLDRPDGEDRTLALVAVFDTSMSMFFPDWKSGPVRKIEMAKRALLNLSAAMRDQDLLGLMGTDFNPYWVLSLTEPRDLTDVEDRLSRIVAFGPGINLYSSLLAAFEGLGEVKADLKHVLVLADTADVDEYEVSSTGSVWDLLDLYRKAGITISVVGFGGSGDEHVPFLNRFTEQSGGFFYLASSIQDVPGFFLEDLEQVGESLVVRKTMKVLFRPMDFPSTETMPAVEGQILVTPKPGAFLAAWTERGYPLFTSWRVGRGSAALFASDDGAMLAPRWSDETAADSWETLLARMLPAQVRADVFADVRRGQARISLRVRDPEDQARPEALWYRPGAEPVRVPLEKTAPLEYEAVIPAIGYGTHQLDMADADAGDGTLLAAVRITSAPPPETAQAAESTEPLEPPPAEEGRSAPWSDPIVFKLMLLGVVGLVVVDELFRVP